MFCPECGKALEDDDFFCPDCGTKRPEDEPSLTLSIVLKQCNFVSTTIGSDENAWQT